MLTPETAEIVDRLREAARLHGEVADLLSAIADTLRDDGYGGLTFVADGIDTDYFMAALAAAAFARLDRDARKEG